MKKTSKSTIGFLRCWGGAPRGGAKNIVFYYSFGLLLVWPLGPMDYESTVEHRTTLL